MLRDLRDEIITVIGFTGLTNPTGVLTWTDDIADFSNFVSNISSQGYVIFSSDLDYVFPYGQLKEVTDQYGNVFIRFPRIWVKWVLDQDGYIDGVKFSNVQIDDSYFLPDCYLDPRDHSCSTYLDSFYLGKYEANNYINGIVSKVDENFSGISINNIKDFLRQHNNDAISGFLEKHDGYQVMDYSMLVLYNFLCMLYYKTSRIQSVLLNFVPESGVNYQENTGRCNLIHLNGCNNKTHTLKMLGLEYTRRNCRMVIGYHLNLQNGVYTSLINRRGEDTHWYNPIIEEEFNHPGLGYIKKFKPFSLPSYIYPAEVQNSSDTYIGERTSSPIQNQREYMCVGNPGWYQELWGNCAYSQSDQGGANWTTRLAYRPIVDIR